MNLNMNPTLLMSIVNTALRDDYDSLDSFCEDKDISKEELVEKLKNAGYEYIENINQFR